MEKQRVNDAVVRLGNLIGKGRTFVVHRLSAKIRGLRRKDEKKFLNRIERLLLEIAYLKTLSNSRSRKLVSRKILLSEDDHASKIESDKTTSEERAFHRLCREKCIAEYVSKFREDNIDWKYWVPPLLEMWEKKQDLKKERSKKNPDRDQKKERRSVKEIAEEKKLKQKRPSKDSSSEQESGSDSESPTPRHPTEVGRKTEQKQAKVDIKDKNPAKKAKTSMAYKEKSSTELDDSSDDVEMNIDEHGFGNLGLASSSASGEDQGNEDEPSSDDADEEVVFNRERILQYLNGQGSHNNEADDSHSDNNNNSDDVGDENDENEEKSDDTNPAGHQPFRPYALKHTGYTDSEDEDDEDHSEASDHALPYTVGGEPESEDDDDPEVARNRRKNIMSDNGQEHERQVEMTKRNNGLDRKAEKLGESSHDEEASDAVSRDEDSDETEEESSEESDEDDEDNSEEETSEDSEDEEEILRKKQLLLGALNKTGKKELQIDFSVQKRLQCVTKDLDDPAIRDRASQKKVQRDKHQQPTMPKMPFEAEFGPADDDGKNSNLNDSSDDSQDSDEGASFFVKEGKQAKEVPSKTIPKEKAPGLNRRERRGYDKKSLHTADGVQDYDERAAGDREAFGKCRKSQNASQQNYKLQGERPFRGNGPYNGHDSRSPFPNRFSRDHPAEQQSRFDRAHEPRRSFGGAQNDFRGGNNQGPQRFSGGKSPGVRKGFGNSIEFKNNFRGIECHGKDHGWPANQDRGNVNRGKGDDRLKNTKFEPQKPFEKKLQNPRGGYRSFNNGSPAESRASSQKGFQGGDNTQTTSFHGNGHDGQSDEKLHPSWAAKKRLSAAINQPFQGKKIVFGDD